MSGQVFPGASNTVHTWAHLSQWRQYSPTRPTKLRSKCTRTLWDMLALTNRVCSSSTSPFHHVATGCVHILRLIQPLGLTMPLDTPATMLAGLQRPLPLHKHHIHRTNMLQHGVITIHSQTSREYSLESQSEFSLFWPLSSA